MNLQELIEENGLDKNRIDESLLKKFVITREELDELHELFDNQLYYVFKILNKFYKQPIISECNMSKFEDAMKCKKHKKCECNVSKFEDAMRHEMCEVNGFFNKYGYVGTIDELEIYTGFKKSVLISSLAFRFDTTTDNIEKWLELCNGRVHSVVKCLEELYKYKRTTDKDTTEHEKKEECYVSVDGVDVKTSKEIGEKYNSFGKEDVKEGEIYKVTDENNKPSQEWGQSFNSSTDEDITTNISQMWNNLHSKEWKKCLNPTYDEKLKESIAKHTKNGSEMPFVDALKKEYIDTSKDIDERFKKSEKEVISTTENKSDSNIKVLNDTFDYSKQLPINSVKMSKEIFNKLKVDDVIAYRKEGKWVYVRLNLFAIKTGTFPDKDEFGNKIFDKVSGKQKFIDILNSSDVQIYYIIERTNDFESDCKFQSMSEQKEKEIKHEFEEKNYEIIKNDQGLSYIRRKNGDLIGPLNDKIMEDYQYDLYYNILMLMKRYSSYQKYIRDIVKYAKDNCISVSFLAFSDIIKILELNKVLMDLDCLAYIEIISIMQQDSDYQRKINNIIEYCSNKQIDIKELSVNDIGDVMKFELDNLQIKEKLTEKIAEMNHKEIIGITNNFNNTESEAVDYLMINFKEMLSKLIKKIKYMDCDDKIYIMGNLYSLSVSISDLSKSINENIKWERIKR